MGRQDVHESVPSKNRAHLSVSPQKENSPSPKKGSRFHFGGSFGDIDLPIFSLKDVPFFPPPPPPPCPLPAPPPRDVRGFSQVTQVAGVNPYGKWPEGPRLDWSQAFAFGFIVHAPGRIHRYTYIYIYVHTYKYMYIYICTYVYVFMYCMYVM